MLEERLGGMSLGPGGTKKEKPKRGEKTSEKILGMDPKETPGNNTYFLKRENNDEAIFGGGDREVE